VEVEEGQAVGGGLDEARGKRQPEQPSMKHGHDGEG
jgi:hypothetical protein